MVHECSNQILDNQGAGFSFSGIVSRLVKKIRRAYTKSNIECALPVLCGDHNQIIVASSAHGYRYFGKVLSKGEHSFHLAIAINGTLETQYERLSCSFKGLKNLIFPFVSGDLREQMITLPGDVQIISKYFPLRKKYLLSCSYKIRVAEFTKVPIWNYAKRLVNGNLKPNVALKYHRKSTNIKRILKIETIEDLVLKLIKKNIRSSQCLRRGVTSSSFNKVEHDNYEGSFDEGEYHFPRTALRQFSCYTHSSTSFVDKTPELDLQESYKQEDDKSSECTEDLASFAPRLAAISRDMDLNYFANVGTPESISTIINDNEPLLKNGRKSPIYRKFLKILGKRKCNNIMRISDNFKEKVRDSFRKAKFSLWKKWNRPKRKVSPEPGETSTGAEIDNTKKCVNIFNTCTESEINEISHISPLKNPSTDLFDFLIIKSNSDLGSPLIDLGKYIATPISDITETLSVHNGVRYTKVIPNNGKENKPEAKLHEETKKRPVDSLKISTNKQVNPTITGPTPSGNSDENILSSVKMKSELPQEESLPPLFSLYDSIEVPKVDLVPKTDKESPAPLTKGPLKYLGIKLFSGNELEALLKYDIGTSCPLQSSRKPVSIRRSMGEIDEFKKEENCKRFSFIPDLESQAGSSDDFISKTLAASVARLMLFKSQNSCSMSSLFTSPIQG